MQEKLQFEVLLLTSTTCDCMFFDYSVRCSFVSMAHMNFTKIWQKNSLSSTETLLWWQWPAVYERLCRTGLEGQFAALSWCNMQPSFLVLLSSYFPMLWERIEDVIWTLHLIIIYNTPCEQTHYNTISKHCKLHCKI